MSHELILGETGLNARQCVCRKEKRSGDSFCHRCYALLDPLARRALYRRMGAGYEEAHAAALLQLLALGRLKG